MKRAAGRLALAFALVAPAGCAPSAPPPRPAAAARPAAGKADARASIARSDQYAQRLLAVLARFAPEGAQQLGVEGLDEAVFDLAPGHETRQRQATAEVLAALRAARPAERDPLVRQDLDILIRAADLGIRSSSASERYEVPYYNLSEIVFGGVKALLEEQVAPARRPAALARVKRYAGLEPGRAPVVELAKAETRAALGAPNLLPPSRLEIERHLGTNAVIREGLGELFRRYNVPGHEGPVGELVRQLADYDAFLRAELLPRARATFALPAPLYALALESYGVDLEPGALRALARAAFRETQAEMQRVAAEVARAKGLPSADYRDVLRELKKDQLDGAAILPHYRGRLAQIEDIIRREGLLTLPARPARIRLATAAESARTPAPHMDPPPLLNNRGEQGEFILPLALPGAAGAAGAADKLDDFTYAAASWTLTAHEARPGHELQFASLVERGVPVARAVYAFNSTNVEGWGLYSEHIVYPFMPPEGKLVSLQMRLQREARAFVDPELQLGNFTPDSARAFLQKEVGLSPALANSEVERYTFRSPGQATSYYYGYYRLLGLRRELEAKLGPRFDPKAFHDFILSQGLLPPALLREAALAHFT